MSDSSRILQNLYPHMDKSPGVRDTDKLLADSITAKVSDSLDCKARFFHDHRDALIAAAVSLTSVLANGRRLFCMGNGGSSCDAAHLALEFSHPVTAGRPALPAIDLGNDSAMLTAVANDVGFDEVFSRQLFAQAQVGDALFGFSTSGNSDNLVNGFRTARKLGLSTFALLGGDGGKVAKEGDVNHCLIVDSASVHRIQECHVLAYHILWDLVHTLMAVRR